jgi:succinate dehydrogenase/fumarate reductase flavoprotein subunit
MARDRKVRASDDFKEAVRDEIVRLRSAEAGEPVEWGSKDHNKLLKSGHTQATRLLARASAEATKAAEKLAKANSVYKGVLGSDYNRLQLSEAEDMAREAAKMLAHAMNIANKQGENIGNPANRMIGRPR